MKDTTHVVVQTLLEGDAALFRGMGIGLALVLILLLRITLARSERRRIRVPFVLLALHVVAVIAQVVFFDIREAPQSAASKGSSHLAPLEAAALFFLLSSLASSAFALLVHTALGHKFIRPLPKIFRDIVQAIIYAAVVLITLRAAGVEPGSLLTTSALLTAVVGLSLQDTLGNMFAGLAIQTQQPFQIGDWIQLDDTSKQVGQVIEINWRATKLLTNDLIEITVPNSMIAKTPLRNFTKPSFVSRRSVFFVTPLDVPPEHVKAAISRTVSEISELLREPAPTVLVQSFTERGTEYCVRFFISDFSNRDLIESLVRERVWYALRRAGIEISIPVRTIHMREVSDDTAARELAEQVIAHKESLRKVDFLQPLPEDAIERLAALTHVRLYSRGERIIRQGEEGNELFVIRRGEVTVLIDGDDKKGIEVAKLGRGKFFGEMSLMTGERRAATVQAATECELLVVGKNAFQQIVEASPELLIQISQILSLRQAELGERMPQASVTVPTEAADKSRVLLARIRDFFSMRP